MKNTITPTNNERKLESGSFIVSKSDLQGKVTYCNRALMQISGYSEPELLGNQHNLLRHPDMPRSIFNLLWENIKNGRECFAYIKNLCKNGDYYWVLANVTPDFDENKKICGYFSVRRSPEENAITEISAIYEEMLKAEKQSNAAEAIEAGTNILNSHLSSGNQDYETFILSI